jgi:hypothetical protein
MPNHISREHNFVILICFKDKFYIKKNKKNNKYFYPNFKKFLYNFILKLRNYLKFYFIIF